MPKYRVKIILTYESETTIEAPSEAVLKKVLKNDIKTNPDDWEFEEKIEIEAKEDKILETPAFKLDNGVLIDYDVPSEEDLEEE